MSPFSDPASPKPKQTHLEKKIRIKRYSLNQANAVAAFRKKT